MKLIAAGSRPALFRICSLSRRAALQSFLAIGLVGAAALPAAAQSAYPNRPIRVIVPFAAGGGNDIFARVVGAKASDILGQPLVIENRPAAGGRPAAEYVTHQPADGYTLFVGASGVMSIASAAYPNLAYHPTKSFTPLAMIASFPLILISPENLPVKNVRELVDYAKAHPDKSNYGTTSPAFTIASELLKLKTGMPAVAVPVKSSAEMVLCVMQGFCLLTISDGPPAIPQISAGKVRALAVTGAERSPELPDTPSMAEAGFPEVNTKLWSGFFAPAGLAPELKDKLEKALQAAISDPDVSARLRTMAVTPGAINAAQFCAMIDADIKTYVEVVKAAQLTFE